MSLDFWLSPWTIFGAGASITAIFAALWFLAPGLVPTLLASKLGRQLAAIGAAIFALWLAFVAVAKRGERKGAQKINDQLKENSEKLETNRNTRDAELKKLPPDKLVERSKPWLRD
jgi:hypothetical protein